MKIKEIVQTTPNFQVLSEDEIERIYFDALGIIESDGARVNSPAALERFKKSEAVVTDTNLVRIPTVLVEAALRSHPRKIVLAGRNRERAVRLQKDELAFGTGPLFPVLPPEDNQENNQSASQDIYNAARLADYLPNFDYITGPLALSSENGGTSILSQVVAMLEGSDKPMLLGSGDPDALYRLWQMGKLVCGGETEFRLSPLFANYVEIDSPLTLSAAAAEQLTFCAEKRIPCACASRAIAGITAPAALAGILVQTLAETMLVSVLSYLVNPGMPLIRGVITTAPSPSGQRYCYGAPELLLSAAANTDVSKWLGLGMLFPAGITDAPGIDQDAGVDCASSLFYAFLSGADLIYGAGLINSGETTSLDIMVICNEIIEMIKQIGKGISTDDDYLALELIESVGPGGEYLTQDHTYQYWQEWFRPRLIDRAGYESWVTDGKKTMKDRTEAERRKILAEHVPAPIEPKLLAELRALAAETEQGV
ncbi:MAG: trimethylamine methyltransferase family protein [Desulfobacterales bacterium]|nr:trimethylamine methyltransferase family protein [Desulfobacterales bacterium]